MEKSYPPQGYPPQQGIYPPQPQGYPPQQQPPSYDQKAPPHQNQSHNDRFEYVKTGPKYQDFWATLLFIAHFIVFVVLSGIGISYMSNMPPANTTSPTNFTGGNTTAEPIDLITPPNFVGDLAGAFVVASLVAAALCAFYVWLMRTYPVQLIKISFLFGIVLLVIIAIIAIVTLPGAGFIIAIPLLLVAGLNYWCYRCIRPRIPLSAMIMETVVEVFNKYPTAYSFAFMNLVIAFAYQIWWAASISGISMRFNQSAPILQDILSIFLVFSLYWTMQILQNTLHVTIAGTLASYYFMHGTDAMPANPTLGAAKRAFTTSFGPVAYGSLIIALLRTLRYIIRHYAGENSMIGCLLHCVVACVESVIEYINSYAFVQVAIYGKAFCEAAKDTFNLLSTTGVQMIVNDTLIDSVINFGGFVVGLISCVVGVVWLSLAWAKYMGPIAILAIIAVAFALLFIGFFMMSIVGMVVISGEKTLFVCLAEDPAALARTKPQLFAKFKEVYPQVAWRA